MFELNKRPKGGHARLLELVGDNKRVLDVGCSSGYLARPLVEHGCTVVGIEYDPDAAHAAQSVRQALLVGDVEAMEQLLEEASFDVFVVRGDVIDYPSRSGCLSGSHRALSAPRRWSHRPVTLNVANWALRLSLLVGRWRYTDRGILDRTHLHLRLHATNVGRGCFSAQASRSSVFDHTIPVPSEPRQSSGSRTRSVA